MFRQALVLCLFCAALPAQTTIHTWELKEIGLRSTGKYASPYTDVECWVDLKGPSFSKRIYGFWDGGEVFRVRVVATAPGAWTWTSGSNQPADTGAHRRVTHQRTSERRNRISGMRLPPGP